MTCHQSRLHSIEALLRIEQQLTELKICQHRRTEILRHVLLALYNAGLSDGIHATLDDDLKSCEARHRAGLLRDISVQHFDFITSFFRGANP